jgi:hypothetical protein
MLPLRNTRQYPKGSYPELLHYDQIAEMLAAEKKVESAEAATAANALASGASTVWSGFKSVASSITPTYVSDAAKTAKTGIESVA